MNDTGRRRVSPAGGAPREAKLSAAAQRAADARQLAGALRTLSEASSREQAALAAAMAPLAEALAGLRVHSQRSRALLGPLQGNAQHTRVVALNGMLDAGRAGTGAALAGSLKELTREASAGLEALGGELDFVGAAVETLAQCSAQLTQVGQRVEALLGALARQGGEHAEAVAQLVPPARKRAPARGRG
jgi:hypothetical protein